MQVQGSINIKSIATVGLRVNEGLVTKELTSDIALDKYAHKHQYYYTQQNHTITLPKATELPVGWSISMYSMDTSTGTLLINDFGGTKKYKLSRKKSVTIILLDNTTDVGVWRVVESGVGGVGSRNVVITAPTDIFAITGGAVNVDAFVGTISDGFDEDGTAIEEIIEFEGNTALSLPSDFPSTKYVYLTLEGLIVEEEYKQRGGNVFPTTPVEGQIFYHKPLRKNYKYDNGEWIDYPCVAVGEVSWESPTKAVAITYPFNEWWWDDHYGEFRNTPVISSGSVISVTAGTPSTAAVGNIVVTVANGYDENGLPIDYPVALPYTQTVELLSNKPSYLYVDQYGNVLVEQARQDGYNELPEIDDKFPNGAIVYSHKEGRNYKVVNNAWEPFLAVPVGEVTNNVAKVYPYNTHWWELVEYEALATHTQQFYDAVNATTQVTLDTPCLGKEYLTVNVGNTLLLSDTYELANDGVTVSFVNAIDPGTYIEIRWYIPLETVSVVTTGANKDLSNLTAAGNNKLIPTGGGVGDVLVRGEDGTQWRPATGMTIGTVFMSDLVSPYVPAGALEYNGTEVTDASTTYPEFYAKWLTEGRFAVGSYEQYEAALAANGGTCPFFALDTTQNKFKTPTWATGVFPSAAATTADANVYKAAGLPNITGNTDLAPNGGVREDATANGALFLKDATGYATTFSQSAGKTVGFDASRSNTIYGASNTVQPVSVQKRWFVQVANAVESTVFHNIDSELVKINSDINTLETAKQDKLVAGENIVITGNVISSEGGSDVTVDNSTIVQDATSKEITAVGVKTKSNIIKYDWIGTNAEYEALVVAGTVNPTWFYYITDDSSETDLDARFENKADKDFSNVPSNYDYVVESKLPTDEDPSWYRVYKSGWVEQGGTVPAQGSGTTVTITLLKAMKNTKFTVLTNPISTNNAAASNNYVNVFNITTTSFNLQVWNFAEKRWCVFGQGAN